MTEKNSLVRKEVDIVRADYIHFAYIGRPHGLKGGFFLKTEDRRTVWDKYKTLFIETPNNFIEKKVTRHYLSGGALVLELEGLSSRMEIEALYNKKLFVHKKEIKLNKHEYLVHDLLNFSVINSEKGFIGNIVGVVSYGAQENLEIKLAGSEHTALYPFIDKYILHLNYENKQIEVEYLEEFLEV